MFVFKTSLKHSSLHSGYRLAPPPIPQFDSHSADCGPVLGLIVCLSQDLVWFLASRTPRVPHWCTCVGVLDGAHTIHKFPKIA